MARQLPLVIAVACMLTACGARAGDRSPGPGMGLTQVNDELPTVSADDEARALSALQAEPTFQAVTDGIEWEVAQTMPNVQEDGEVSGMGMIIELSTPVDSDGPWKYVSCRGTRVTESTAPFRGITTLSAGFDAEGTLLRFKPLLVDGTTLLPPETPRPSPEPCPPGLEDEEN